MWWSAVHKYFNGAYIGGMKDAKKKPAPRRIWILMFEQGGGLSGVFASRKAAVEAAWETEIVLGPYVRAVPVIKKARRR